MLDLRNIKYISSFTLQLYFTYRRDDENILELACCSSQAMLFPKKYVN